MRFSVIIPAWNIENFIEQALHSCCQPGAEHCEFIVVDDCSEDRTAELVERFMADQGAGLNMRLIRKTANGGLGMARNTGLDAASGDYILFLDGDDWFAEGILERLRDVIMARDPDVVVFSHVRVYGNGRVSINRAQGLLAEKSKYNVADRQALMDAFGVAWNKIYRRSFLDHHGFRFRVGLYEDINWSFPILLTAGRLHTIPDVGVFYRQRVGSILRSTSRAHLDVIDQEKSLLEWVRAKPQIMNDYGAALFRTVRRQLFHTLEQGRIPKESAPSYVSETFGLIKEWRSCLSIKTRDIALLAHEKGGYAGYRAFHFARPWAKRIVKAARRTGSATVGNLRRLRDGGRRGAAAVVRRLRPVSPKKVFFESYWGAKADCNPLAISRALDKVGGFDIVWCFSPTAALPKEFPWRTVRRGSFAMLREAATARYFVSNANVHDDIVKRSGTIHLQTWHGTPLKLMGVDIRPRNPAEMDWDKFVSRSLRWDYMLSSNPHSSYAWRRACPFHYTTLETGYPRNDIFFTATEADRKRIRAALGVPDGKKVALYAPTWREDMRGQPLAVTPDIFDADTVLRALGKDYVLLIRAHYFMRRTDTAAMNAIDVSAYPDTNEVALISDLLITDYSSIMFDYACLRRPVVLYQYDYEDYLRRRGVYFDISKVPPGPIVATLDALCECLSRRSFDTPETHAMIGRFADRFAPWDDGRSTERVLEKVFGIPRLADSRF
jgi:CDP-glycerol glycerophosphotransferase